MLGEFRDALQEADALLTPLAPTDKSKLWNKVLIAGGHWYSIETTD